MGTHVLVLYSTGCTRLLVSWRTQLAGWQSRTVARRKATLARPPATAALHNAVWREKQSGFVSVVPHIPNTIILEEP